MKKIITIISVLLVLMTALVGCDSEVKKMDENKVNENKVEENKVAENVVKKDTSYKNNMYKDTELKEYNFEKNPIVTMTMENGDIIKMELYPDVAPTTVANFVDLVENKYYDDLTFHRVIPGFMAQGGDPLGNGTGGSGREIKGEFSANNVENALSHEVGVVSMARANDPNSASSQFFIVTDEAAAASLDGNYAAFGKVIEGMTNVYTIVNAEVIRRDYSDEFYQAYIEAGQQIIPGTDLYEQYLKETGELDRPVNPPTIKEMVVEY